ncbi:hypothetical protein TNCV_582161 [Trichonephila clavipes]|nr:hypothetical protein TNCV_582161 [Trichonephila clavipes]
MSKKAEKYYMYNHENGNGRAAQRMYHAQCSFLIENFRIFQRLFCRLRETRSFQVTSHDAGRCRAVHSPSLEEIILNVVADRPK